MRMKNGKKVAIGREMKLTNMSSPAIPEKELTITIPEPEIDTIHNVTVSEKAKNRETGGVLLGGRLSETEIFCMRATRPGPEAEQYKTEFSPDVEYAQDIIDTLREDFDVVWIGTWHKHPGALNELSRGDIQQMKEFVNDSELLDEIIAVITTIDGDTVKINPFYMDKRHTIDKVNVEVIGTDETQEKLNQLKYSNEQDPSSITPMRHENERVGIQNISPAEIIEYILPHEYKKKVQKYLQRLT